MGRRSDPGWRDQAALDLLTRRVLPTLGPGHDGTLLLVGEPSAGIGIEGRDVVRWDRVGTALEAGSMLPEPTDVAIAAVRMPRSRAALAFATRAAAAALAPDGLLLVYGANDEGTGASGRELSALGVTATTWAVGGRCRVVGGTVPDPVEPLDVDAIEQRESVVLPHLGEREWISFPGTFAAGRLDAGTRVLLTSLESLPAGTSVLDYGAGTGAIGAVALALGAERVTMLERDALAAEAARRNVPEARVVEGSGWRAAGDERFDLVLANPPYHRGKVETVAPVLEFLAGLRDHLTDAGRVRFVVQRRLPVESALRERFPRVDVIADEGPFRVWDAGFENTTGED